MLAYYFNEKIMPLLRAKAHKFLSHAYRLSGAVTKKPCCNSKAF